MGGEEETKLKKKEGGRKEAGGKRREVKKDWRKESVWIIILYVLEWSWDREQGAIWRVVEEKMRGEPEGRERRAG